MSVKASVSLFWQPYGFDVEPTSPLSEQARLEYVVSICADVQAAMSTLFPNDQIASDLHLDLEPASGSTLVLEEELLNAIRPALEKFNMTKATYDGLSDAQRTSFERLDLNPDKHTLATRDEADVVLEFDAELSISGYSGRYYYADGSRIRCCSTGIALLANGQPIRVGSTEVEAEADVLLRSEFVLIEEGGSDVPA